jgi:aspartyl aminopeptidase
MLESARDLLAFIDAAPTPYHAVFEIARRLGSAGFTEIEEADAWQVEPGARHYVVRGDGSIIAFERGTASPAEAGFRGIGAHTDSPNLRIKPNADVSAGGQRLLRAEPYGGVLLHSWFDRDLGLAGRVALRGETEQLRTRLLRMDDLSIRVPNLAIHLNREIREQGFQANAQQHMVPLLGLGSAPALKDLLSQRLQQEHGEHVAPEDILGYDLMAYDLQPSALGGHEDAYVYAPRLDNLASCHAGVVALAAAADAGPAAHTRVVACWDHEEVGSSSAHGAAGTFLGDVLRRLAPGEEAWARAVARSALVSADMAHAVQPNYMDRHMPILGAGPVIKVNQNQRYASDAATIGMFRSLCDEVGTPVQEFVNRADLACGSTIGPVTATRLGIRTVDVGGPMLSMHSCREMCASADVPRMIRVMQAFLSGSGNPA